VKHPVLKGKKKKQIKEALSNPEEVRKDRKDENVFLFTKANIRAWICAVAKHESGEGFLITAYPTDSIKAGDTHMEKVNHSMTQVSNTLSSLDWRAKGRSHHARNH